MKQIKVLFLLLIFYVISSCGTISEGFKSSKENQSDEFLVEKKSPLVMPPNFDELPAPIDKTNNDNSEQENIENFIKKNPKKKLSNNSNSDLESSVIEKIKNN